MSSTNDAVSKDDASAASTTSSLSSRAESSGHVVSSTSTSTASVTSTAVSDDSSLASAAKKNGSSSSKKLSETRDSKKRSRDSSSNKKITSAIVDEEEARRARKKERKERRKAKKKARKEKKRLEAASAVAAVAAPGLTSQKSTSTEMSYCTEIVPASLSAEEKEAAKLEKMASACRTILECIGENPDREGLVKTPTRWAKALLFLNKGYHQTIEEVTNDAVFTEDSHKEMVVVRDIDIHSLCEHHMVPFTGRVHVGYIPNGKIIGLSKIARVAELFSRRLQVQERLTSQIADAIVEAVEPLGVAVVVECSHFCMVMRGVQKCSARTVTSSVRGCFESNSKTRAEFFSIINGSNVKLC